jgi:uncharacterized protein (DUF1501 family)
MELIERGVSDESGPASGWIGRYLSNLKTGVESPMRAVSLGKLPKHSLNGPIPVTALNSIKDYHYAQSRTAQQILTSINILYSGDDQLSQVGKDTIRVLNSLQKMDPDNYQSSGEYTYPSNEFAEGLKQIAMLFKAQVGLQAAAIDLGGWDTHFAQGGTTGIFSNLIRQLSKGLAAFYSDLSDYKEHLTIVVMSEFGRRAKENGSLGTDHGHGGLMFVLGGGLNGGRVYCEWPGLEDSQLSGPGDLAVTTDYRDVLGELCAKRLKNPILDVIFPDFTFQFQGLVS